MSELFYTLDQEEIHKKQYLVVHIKEDTAGPKRILYRDSLLKSAPAHKELLLFLIQEEIKFLGLTPLSQQINTLPFNKIRVPAIRAQSALKLLGATGKLTWKGKKLLVDPFSPAKLQYIASSNPDSDLLIEGRALIGEKEHSLIGMDILPGPCLIKDGVCYFLTSDLDWKWVQMVYPAPSILKGAKKQSFIDQFEDEDPDLPKVIWKDQIAQEKETSVLPYLILSDRSGAFADLWMDYGSFGNISHHDPKKTTWRCPEIERSWEKDLLETAFIKKMVGTTHYYCPLDQVAKSLTFLLEIGWKIFDHQGRQVIRQTSSELALNAVNETIHLRGSISFDAHMANLADVVGAFNRKERFVDLTPQTVGLIDPVSVDRDLKDVLGEEIIDGGIRIKKSHFGILESFFENPGVQRDSAVLKMFSKEGRITEQDVGKDFKGTLYPYQQEGLNWISFLYEGGFHGLLADEMGLGKTVQVLAFLSRIETSKPILIIMPTSLLFNWRKEFEKFLPSTACYVHEGPLRQKEKDLLLQKQVILTSYAILRQDEALFESIDYSCIILDEAQYIKNPEAQVSEAVFKLRGSFRLAITGTPIENRLEDLWSLFYFLMPSLLGERREFSAKMLSVASDPRYLIQLKKKVRPFILRREKKEVAPQLPPKYEQIVWVEMQEAQRGLYEEWLAKNRLGLLKKIESDGINSCRMEILEAILRLRQICCHPMLIESSMEQNSAKLERLIEDLEEIVSQGKKAIVYSQFTKMLRLIEKELQQRGWAYVMLDGSTKDRGSIVDQFQENDKIPIFLMSLKAGGVGLNLTSADYVFLFDPWWNEAVESQAIDRAHRFGREDAVIARRYVTAESIEEKIMRLKEHKTKLAHGMLSFEDTIDHLTLQDLYHLIS